MAAMPPTERTIVKRHPDRAVYEREVVDAILDEALFCHVACVVDGAPRVIPTIHARVGDTLYLHGSTASRTLRALRDGADVCVAVTLLDGIVLARSAFNHSMNYRSVLVYGRAREVVDTAEKWEAQQALVEHVVPGRSTDARMPDERELKQTTIVAVSLHESSAKVRTGPPKDRDEDYALPVWAGEIPLSLVAGDPIPDPRETRVAEAPDYVARYRPARGRRAGPPD